MTQPRKQYLLAEDITSNYKDKGKPIVYGKRGEKVTEVGDHGNVVIVESKNGNRFPAPMDKLTEL